MATPDNKVRAKPWLDWGISKEEFDIYTAAKIEREKTAPKIGAEAPDFEVEMLDPDGRRTGEMYQLSSARGQPIALLLGSYT